MRRLGLLVVLTALGACKQTPAAAPIEAEKSPEEAAKPKPVDAGAPAAVKKPTPVALVDPALKEGAYAVWDVQAATLPAGTRAGFVVLSISDEAVEVLMTVKLPRGKTPPALEKGLRFLLLRTPLVAQPKLLPPGASLPVHADTGFHPEPGRRYDKAEAKSDAVMVGGRSVPCLRFEVKSGSDFARGCIAAKTSPVGFFGGAVELEQSLLRLRLVDFGVQPPSKSEAPFAFRPGQVATYSSDAPGVAPITDAWLSGGNRIRYATSEDNSSWEGTLLEVLFDLAALERMEESAYATSYRVNGDRFAALTFKSNGRGPNDEVITEEWVHAEDPWRLQDAPVWVRFWPLQHGLGGQEIDSTLSLTEWK